MSAGTQEQSRGRSWLNALAARPELVMVGLMAVIIAMLIMPLPTFLVDTLIAVNMAIAIMIFMSSFYIERMLHFSTFPSVLLFTTLMRLALSVSTSRLILVDADAGHIIQAFGEFVIADNLIVGFVVFAIVTIVQFIVITKGAERVGEVTARFSLDGMPGKQMSIDADLRAGSITSEQAQARRKDVERESQLFGSFDGAMKFVKGDAIAGIIILLVNLFGGIGVGILQKGMSFKDALGTYTLLTIGDGLVAQIPALLICIGAGFVVTRVSGDGGNLGGSIIKELFASSNVLGVSAALTLALACVPGFPSVIFVGLSAGLFMLFRRRRRAELEALASGADDAAGAAKLPGESLPGTEGMSVDVLPLLLVMPDALAKQWASGGWDARCRDGIFLSIGLRLPAIAVRNSDRDDHAVSLYINEVPAANGWIVGSHHRVVAGDFRPELFPSAREIELGGDHFVIVPDSDADAVREIGGDTHSALTQLESFIKDAALRHVAEVFGVQETKSLMDDQEKRYPELVKETYRHLPVPRLAELLQRLLQEHVSIRYMKLVLETLSQHGGREKDILVLCEHVRSALARYISASFSSQGRVRAIALSAAVEDTFRRGIRQAQSGAFLNIEPAEASDLSARFAAHVSEASRGCHGVVVLAAPDIRRFVKRFIEASLPSTHVLSYSEISATTSVDVMRTL